MYKFTTKTRGDIHPISTQLILDRPDFKKKLRTAPQQLKGFSHVFLFASWQ